MEPKVYKRAAMALLASAMLGISARAQEPKAAAPAAPAPPSPSEWNITIPQADLPSLAMLAPLNMDGFGLPMLQSGDTTYNKKMKKLREQLHDLQKQMSKLNSEEFKKNGAELSRKLALQSKNFKFNFNQNFDKNFSEKFKDFGKNFRFNFEHNDVDLDKKVQSGEVKLKTKTYTKSYTVDNNDQLQIDNRYGKVTVNTWNKSEFKVDVEIKAYADNDEKAKELLDEINIKDSKDNSVIAFTTQIGDEGHKNSFWGTWTTNGKTSVHKAVINYTVYMPAKSPLTITNRYGGVVLPDLYGKVTIKNMYGNLTAKSLTNVNNNISVKYGSADIENLAGSDLDVSYGSLNLVSADRLNADINSASTKIGRLNGSATINAKYGGLQIDNLDKGLKNLSVTSSFAPVKLGSIGNADFDVTVRMAGFSYNDNAVNVTSKTPDDARSWSTSKTYKGHVGKGSNDKTITINSTYGGVKFEQ